jgi:virulence-associated protein VagC
MQHEQAAKPVRARVIELDGDQVILIPDELRFSAEEVEIWHEGGILFMKPLKPVAQEDNDGR